MLNGARNLICEDEPFIALDLALAVRDINGVVVGPAASVKQAKQLLDDTIAAAILDVHLVDGDITPIAEYLLENNVPVVLQTGGGLPPVLEEKYLGLTVFQKPISSGRLVEALARHLGLAAE